MTAFLKLVVVIIVLVMIDIIFLEPVVQNIISSLYQLLIDCEVNTGLLSYFQILCVICGT